MMVNFNVFSTTDIFENFCYHSNFFFAATHPKLQTPKFKPDFFAHNLDIYTLQNLLTNCVR